jgi:hypothetical protein
MKEQIDPQINKRSIEKLKIETGHITRAVRLRTTHDIGYRLNSKSNRGQLMIELYEKYQV